MVYCDKNAKILEWGSEEIALLTYLLTRSRVHRYFPDFYIKVQENTGKIKRYLIEVKPLKQTTKPKKPKDKLKVTFVKHLNMQEIKQNGRQRENIVPTECGSLKLSQKKS